MGNKVADTHGDALVLMWQSGGGPELAAGGRSHISCRLPPCLLPPWGPPGHRFRQPPGSLLTRSHKLAHFFHIHIVHHMKQKLFFFALNLSSVVWLNCAKLSVHLECVERTVLRGFDACLNLLRNISISMAWRQCVCVEGRVLKRCDARLFAGKWGR